MHMHSPAWYCFLLCLLLLLLLLPSASAASPCRPPIPSVEQVHLSLLTEQTICVMWNSSLELEKPAVRYFKGQCSPNTNPPLSTISYGKRRPYPATGGFLYAVSLPGLDPSATYCYTIGESCDYTPPKQFNTPNPTTGIFAALSDAGTWGNVSYIMDNLAADNEVDMVLHPGDLSYGLTEDVWDTFEMVEPVARTKPYMIIPGNWDVKPGAASAFMNRYPQTLYAFYYTSFNYSVFHIIMLSSYDPYDPTSEQYKWLKSDLSKASANRRKHPWIIVCFHGPMYSSNSGHGGGDMKFKNSVEPLLLQFKVDIILTGHDHGYERTYPVRNFTVDVSQDVLLSYTSPIAPIHILVGTAGATLDSWLSKPDWSAHRESSFGYTKFIASHDTLHVLYIRQDLSIGDEFYITKGKRLNYRYILALVMVCVFAILPLVLYKGLPSGLRNILLCHDDFTAQVYKFI